MFLGNPNIAFVKYWGKLSSLSDAKHELNLPLNSSVSMRLDNLWIKLNVEEVDREDEIRIFLEGKEITQKAKKTFDFFRKVELLYGIKPMLRIESSMNFPKGAGIASSAAYFAALAKAVNKIYGLGLKEKELSVLARIGSGSASRSIPGGFCLWKAPLSVESVIRMKRSGKKISWERYLELSKESYAYSLNSKLDLCDLIVLVSKEKKKVASTEGHKLFFSSPLALSRLQWLDQALPKVVAAIGNGDFKTFGEIVEREAMNMHAIMLTSEPPLLYWKPETIEVIEKVWRARESGIECYFTIDAGPNVHVICQRNDLKEVKSYFSDHEILIG